MGSIAREDYVPASHRDTAYMDRAVNFSDGSVLNPPVSTALLLQAAEVREDDDVLLVGKAAGYVADILKRRVSNLTIVDADNLADVQTGTRYSLIVIDGAAAELPAALLQLGSEGARVVTGVIDGAVTRLAKGYVHKGNVALKSFADSEIAPIAAFARKREFVF
jgi:protein-L-isoaspartate(D-aspartate) O-methyltransferase